MGSSSSMMRRRGFMRVNPKAEVRNPKEIRSPKSESRPLAGRSSFGLRVSFELRFSSFEFSCLSLLQRNIYREPTPLPHFAPHRHPSAVCFDDVLHDAQTDAHAGSFAAQLGAEPVEALEDALVFR